MNTRLVAFARLRPSAGPAWPTPILGKSPPMHHLRDGILLRGEKPDPGMANCCRELNDVSLVLRVVTGSLHDPEGPPRRPSNS